MFNSMNHIEGLNIERCTFWQGLHLHPPLSTTQAPEQSGSDCGFPYKGNN